MENKFKFVITAESEEFENNYIKKYSCFCGGKYQILLRDRLDEEGTIYNFVKTMCLKCNKPADFLFDITEREKKKQKKQKEMREKDGKRRSSRKRRSRRASGSILNVAKDISDAFISFGDPSDPELQKIMDSLSDENPQANPSRKSEVSIKEYDHLKFLYAQALAKIRYLEEEIVPSLERELTDNKQDMNKMKNTLQKLTLECDQKQTKIDDLEDLVVEKEEDADIYKRKLEEERKEFEEKLSEVSSGGWRKLLGGR